MVASGCELRHYSDGSGFGLVWSWVSSTNVACRGDGGQFVVACLRLVLLAEIQKAAYLELIIEERKGIMPISSSVSQTSCIY